MVSELSLNTIAPHYYEHGGTTNSSSFLGRIFSFSFSWDKAHLLANLVLVVVGIAYAFFMKLPPLIMFGLGIYGCISVMLYAKSRPSQSKIDDLNAKYSVSEEKNTMLEEKCKAKTLKLNKVSEILQDEVKRAKSGSERFRILNQISDRLMKA